MAALPLATEDGHIRDGLPASRCENLYLVATEGGPAKFALVDRSGLSSRYVLAGGDCRGVFRQSGVFNGDQFSVNGTKLYREQVEIATVADGAVARFAASDAEVVCVVGGYAYSYNGTTCEQITDPDLPAVRDVANLAGRFIYVGQAPGGQFFWSAIGDARSIDGLDFATAESSPDSITTAEVNGDDLMFFGGDTVEIWNPNASADAPYVRSSGRRYTHGIAGFTSVQIDNTVMWLGGDRRVYRAGSVANGISSKGLEARIAECTDLANARAWPAQMAGEQFYVLSLPEVGTWAYQISVQRWHKWSSFQRITFRASCAVVYQGQTFLGDSETGDMWTLDATSYADDDEPLIRASGIFIPMLSGSQRVKNVSLLCAKGIGLATGQGSAPTVEMRYSDAVDANWSDLLTEPLGVAGDRTIKTTWWSLGLMESPGRAYEFQLSDPVPWTAYGISMNEDRP